MTQDVLGDARVQASDIQRTLVRLRGSTATEGTTAAGRHHAALVTAATHRRSDRGRDRIGVLRNMERRGRQVRRVRAGVLAILVARRTRVGLRRRWELARGRGRTVVSHLCELVALGCLTEEQKTATNGRCIAPRAFLGSANPTEDTATADDCLDAYFSEREENSSSARLF